LFEEFGKGHVPCPTWLGLPSAFLPKVALLKKLFKKIWLSPCLILKKVARIGFNHIFPMESWMSPSSWAHLLKKVA